MKKKIYFLAIGLLVVNLFGFASINGRENKHCLDNVTIQDSIIPLGLTAQVSDALCKMEPNGVIDLNIDGGTQPYGYLWSNGSTTEDLTGLFAGQYEVTVTDATDAVVVGNWMVNEPGEVSFTGVSTGVSCFGASDGSITIVQIDGGTAPYTYIWSTGATTYSVSGLTAGYYFLTIMDANGCDVSGISLVIQPQELGAIATFIAASCTGANDGSIDLTVSGGTEPYNFLWSNGETVEDLTGVAAGHYTVTVTDFNACEKTATVEVSEISGMCQVLAVSGNVTSAVCYNATQDIYVAGLPGTFFVQNGGSATIIAGLKILFYPGMQVFAGGYLHAYIAPDGPYCNVKSLTGAEETGTRELSSSSGHGYFSLYPNPTSGNFTIEQIKNDINRNVLVEVYGMHGELLLSSQMAGEKRHDFTSSLFAPGPYFVKIIADDYTETIKMIKTR